MQELGVQQREHAELQARHEQLQQALRQHEQVTDILRMHRLLELYDCCNVKKYELVKGTLDSNATSASQMSKPTGSLEIGDTSLQGSPSLARGPSIEAGSESAQAPGTAPLEEEDPQDADGGTDDTLEHKQERLHDVVCSSTPGDDAHKQCKSPPTACA